jgi:hypothetical protein
MINQKEVIKDKKKDLGFKRDEERVLRGQLQKLWNLKKRN